MNHNNKNQIFNNLQQDIIKIKDKKIFINPFLYSRKFDKKTKYWLREPGQISNSRITLNRGRFYPEIKWEYLSFEEKVVKETAIELFLKTIEIIKTFHPNLNSEELLEVENKLCFAKKIAFEKWSKNYFIKKERVISKEERKLRRANLIKNWQKWFFLKETQRLFVPIFVIILLSALTGWFAGVSRNSCNPYFESSNKNEL